ncbi:MAG: patatin-like phospholipase family protein [Acidobacteria bacterium]|nr:patatin-like phospholipase family protein [Acidobacteriota bacterium]
MVGGRTRLAAPTLVLTLLAWAWLRAAPPPPLVATYWSLPPQSWRGSAAFRVPEDDPAFHLGLESRRDLGVAFSGGGTRSAAATAGELRGLAANHWLPRVRYITGVSGGSWAAVPFTYTDRPLDTFLPPLVAPEALAKAVVEARPPEGSLALAIVKSTLLAPGAGEVVKIAGRQALERQDVPQQLRSLAERFVRGSNDQTYAGMLGDVFIKPLVPGALTRYYTWNAAERDRIKALNPSLSVSDFVTAADDRPFLIVGGSIIATHPAYDYPRLVPVELTPLYTGVRQEYGSRLGGTYVSPYAYDAASATVGRDHTVQVAPASLGRRFTLADMIATSGAAPLLALFRGQGVPQSTLGVQFFPAFNPFAIRNDRAEPVAGRLPHGDGGFTDNLGVMPLLARQVHNIIVFVNAKEPIRDNPSVESLFWALDRQDEAGGDRSMNHVFESGHFDEVERGLARAVAEGGAAVYCGTNWKVLPNELYNIAGYEGLNICWVYIQAIPSWTARLPMETRKLLTSRGFRNFPWFSTFEQNVPFLIHLKPAQVNLLSQLAAWSITNEKSRTAIHDALGTVLD